jgi:zinc transport system permease protein
MECRTGCYTHIKTIRNMMWEALQFEFMQNALMAGLLASLICGIMGTLVVVNRIVFLSGGIAHAAYGGIGLAFFLGWPYLLGTAGFALFIALVMAAITLKAKHRSDTIIGVLWAVGMALGIILIDLTPGYNVDLMSYLFGSILTVPVSDLWLMLAVGVMIIGVVTYFYNDYLALSYDEEFARIRGVRVRALYFLLIGMLAVSIVMIIRVVGLILVIALLTIPPFIAEKYSKSLFKMMLFSCLLSSVFTLTGLWLSYNLNLTSGASIILVAGIGFLISLVIERWVLKFRRIY